jgi:CsoR family transcriptional regulator, copper-sensing transcriptional repressor
MSLCGDEKTKRLLLARIKKIEGQMRGLSNMVEKDRDCIEVLRQIASASGALRGAWTLLVGEHLRGCIKNAVLNKDSEAALINELVDHLQKIR